MKINLWLTMLFLICGNSFAATTHISRNLQKFPVNDQKPGGYQIGDAISNFRLKNVDGNTISLNDYASSKGIIIIFTSNHCPFAKAYEDRIIALNTKYASQGFAVVAVNPSDPGMHQDDSFEKMKERAASKNYGFPYLADDTQQVAKAFGVVRTPQVYVIQKIGATFTLKYMGMIDDNPQDPAGATKFYVDDAVSNLLSGKPVVTTVTKPIGCAVKWKNP